jgi:hypothetical protein
MTMLLDLADLVGPPAGSTRISCSNSPLGDAAPLPAAPGLACGVEPAAVGPTAIRGRLQPSTSERGRIAFAISSVR